MGSLSQTNPQTPSHNEGTSSKGKEGKEDERKGKGEPTIFHLHVCISAINKRYIAYFSGRMRKTAVFVFPV